jgi:hypothetical protein
MATVAVTEKLWLDGLVHVTDHDPFTGVAVDVGRDVSWTTAGFVLLVVQSPGSVRASVVSTFAGP